MFNITKKEIKWGDKTLSLETGKIGRQASSVVAKMGNTVVICNVTVADTVVTGTDFTPLTVNYIERTYASGLFPSGFIKRDKNQNNKTTLISRLIDRPIRPLFPKEYKHETCVYCTLVSFDPECPPDIVAMAGASAALSISKAPFEGPIAAIRVGHDNGKFTVNPVKPLENNGKLDLVVAGTADSVLMVESEVRELSEEQMLKAVAFGHKELAKIVKFIKDFVSSYGKIEKLPLPEEDSSKLEKEIEKYALDKIKKAYSITSKADRRVKVKAVKEEVREKFAEDTDDKDLVNKVFEIVEHLEKEIMIDNILSSKKRIDGRGPKDVREIKAEIDVLPSTHGSALFTRGETQALVTTTLGSSGNEQIVDNIDGTSMKERFMLHYNFPPYATGETGQLRRPGRRELGHGKLAWRAVNGMVGSKEEFPYVIKVVSEIMESNGSSSMATVCGGSLALMAAGVPMKNPVSGIAMGLVKKGKKYEVLSDILGDEDHLGEMDFKVAGTKNGITALQMDIKCKGITEEIMKKALAQAKDGRLHILKKMNEAISKSKSNVAETAPKMKNMKVPTDKIKDVIGSGGKMIKSIVEKSGANVNINDDGLVQISSNSSESIKQAVTMIENIITEPEVGVVYEGAVRKIIDAGAFVNLFGDKDGFVHISELADYRVDYVDDILREGDVVKVKVIGFDRKGRPKLSYRAVDQATGEDLEK